MLTGKQMEVLSLLEDSIRTTGSVPSFDGIAAAVGLKSKSGVHRLVTALEERGFIRRLPNRARAIEVIRPLSSLSGNRTDLIAAARSLTIDELETTLSEKKRLAA